MDMANMVKLGLRIISLKAWVDMSRLSGLYREVAAVEKRLMVDSFLNIM